MSERNTSVIVGGSSGIGFAVAEALAARGERIVLTSRDAGGPRPRRARSAATRSAWRSISPSRRPSLASSQASGGRPSRHSRRRARRNSVKDYDVGRAIRLATIKLVRLCRGHPRAAAAPDGGGVGGAVRRPGARAALSRLDHRHRGHGAVTTMVRNLAYELPPIRFNAIHPGVVADTPAGRATMWSSNGRAPKRPAAGW